MSDYGMGAGQSSAGMKDKYKKGSCDDKQSKYKKDMYDDMGPMVASASAPMEAGTKGVADKSQAKDVMLAEGSKDYGKGNPYRKKPRVKNIKDLRDLAKMMG